MALHVAPPYGHQSNELASIETDKGHAIVESMLRSTAERWVKAINSNPDLVEAAKKSDATITLLLNHIKHLSGGVDGLIYGRAVGTQEVIRAALKAAGEEGK